MSLAVLHPLREVARTSQNLPGTYRFVAADGEIVYVGKSKQLRTRLLSYFRARSGEKGHRVVQEAGSLTWDYEPSEFAALLKELELIKRFRPRMNVQHKRDGRYSFLKLTAGSAPRLAVVNTVADDRAAYYGPFRGGRRVGDAVRELNDVLGLRDCALTTPMRFSDQSDLFAFEHTAGCHRSELRLCLGPCAALCTQAEYRQRVELARAFLAGDADEPLAWLNARMLAAAERWDFEYAAAVRERVKRLENLRDEFSRLREALDSLSFLYRVPGAAGDDRVYVIRRGTVRAVLTCPQSCAEKRRLERVAAEHFAQPEPNEAVVSKHQVDEILLIARWFRGNPGELANTVPPERADALPLSA
ncbi:MAG TPA: GIY-YIG nuclease family protein [Longimicrobium sp.]|nr:GIY-YIG nuclease family protein [Longimicrobium sp.]